MQRQRSARAARGRSRATRPSVRCAAAAIARVGPSTRTAPSRPMVGRRGSDRWVRGHQAGSSPRSATASALAEQRLDDLAEGIAARFVVAELVEAGAGRARASRRRPAAPRPSPGAPPRTASRCAAPACSGSSRSAKRGPGLADGVGGGDVAEMRRALVEIVALGQAADDPVDRVGFGGKAASAGAVEAGLVALLSLTNSTPFASATRSMRCGRPWKLAQRRPPLRLGQPQQPRRSRPRPRRSGGCAAPAAKASQAAARRGPRAGSTTWTAAAGAARRGTRAAIAAVSASPQPNTACWSALCIANSRALEAT